MNRRPTHCAARSSAARWIQAVTPDRARSVVMVYRALGGLPERTIHPRGLRPGASYTVSYADAGITVVRSAEDIQARGVRAALGKLSSEVIELELVLS
jgi:hypothetical protein